MNRTLGPDNAVEPTIRVVNLPPSEAPSRQEVSLRPGPGPLTLILVALLGVLLIVMAAFVFYQMTYADRIYPGVQVDGVDLGGYTRAEARAVMAQHVEKYTDATITFRYGDLTWRPTLAEAGATIDPTALANIAYSMGRTGSPVQRLRQQWNLFFEAQSADLPKLGFDPGSRRAYIGELTKAIDRPAIPSRVEIKPDLRTVVTPSQVGHELQVDQALELLGGTVEDVVGQTYDLPVREEQPTVREADLQPVAARVERMIAAPLTLEAGGQAWTLSREQIADLLDVSPTLRGETDPTKAIVVDPAGLQPTLDAIAKEIEVKPVNAQLEWKDNRAQIRVSGKTGHALEMEKARDLIQERLPAEERTVALPVAVVEPAVSAKTLPTLGLNEVVKRTQTSFAGSIPPRAHNVRLAAQRLNNALVMPGEVFSFNDTIGPMTLDAGWQVGYGITAVGDGEHKTVPSVAGGICQVATTLFQAVFWSGYQIEERYYHLYWIESYGKPPDGLVGLDATVDAPDIDFQWKNTTDKPILIHSGTDGDNVFFELISTRPNWSVSVEPPKYTNVKKADPKVVEQQDPTLPAGQKTWVEHAMDGFDVEIVRRVQAGNEEPRKLTLTSRYKPANNVVLVGTGGRPVANTTPGPNTTPGAGVPATPGPGITPAPGETPPAGGTPAATPVATNQPATLGPNGTPVPVGSPAAGQ